MVRQLGVLALIFIAVVGCVSAVEPAKASDSSKVAPAPAKAAASPTTSADAPSVSEDAEDVEAGAGALSPSDISTAGFIEGPASMEGAAAPGPSEAAKSSASCLGFSTVAGIAVFSSYAFFF